MCQSIVVYNACDRPKPLTSYPNDLIVSSSFEASIDARSHKPCNFEQPLLIIIKNQIIRIYIFKLYRPYHPKTRLDLSLRDNKDTTTGVRSTAGFLSNCD